MASPPQGRDSAEPSGEISNSPPQLGSDDWLRSQRHVYGRQMVGLSSSAAHFVPLGPLDVTFTSLRMVVFQVEPTSATPVSQVIREELNDSQICELLKDVYVSAPVVRSKKTAKSHARTPSSTSDQRVMRVGALRKKMDEARIQLGKNLRDSGFVDVDIIYKCDYYRVEPFKSDKEHVTKFDGKPYHMYPFRKEEKEMAFSVIVQPWVLEKIYPPKRCEQLSITIKTNTAPAPPEPRVPSIPAKPIVGTMFGWSTAPESDTEKVSAETKMDRIIEEIQSRPRSGTVDKVKTAPKAPWHPFSSAIRTDKPQPTWTAFSGPFLGDPGSQGDSQWWLDDLAIRKEAIDDWDRRTWKPVGTSFHRVATEADPETAVAGVDYYVVPPLSGTYTADRNPQWHHDNIEQAVKADLMMEYKVAEQACDKDILKAEAFFQKFTALQLDARLFNCDRQKWHQEFQAARRMEHFLRQEVKKRGDELQKKAKACELRLDLGKFEMFDQLAKKMRRAVNAGQLQRGILQSAQQQHTAPLASPAELVGTPRPQPIRSAMGGRGRQMLTGRASASAETARAPRVHVPKAETQDTTEECQAVQRTEPRTIPFPAYRDPMADHTQDIAGTQQDIRKPTEQPRSRRTNTARALAGILVRTGARQAEQARVDSARTERMSRVRFAMPESPKAPENWSGDTEAAVDEAVAGRAGAVEEAATARAGVDAVALEA